MRIDVWTLLSIGTTSSTSALALGSRPEAKYLCPGIEGARAAVGKTAAADESPSKAPQSSDFIRFGACSLLNVSLGERA